jgi:hypothetical protein
LRQVVVVCLVEPGCFRRVHAFVQSVAGGLGRIEVLSLAATQEGDATAEFGDSMFAQRQERQERATASRCAPPRRCLAPGSAASAAPAWQ